MTEDDNTYDAADNSSKCYALAIRTLRLEGIRVGKFEPRPHDQEEMEAAGRVQASEMKVMG